MTLHLLTHAWLGSACRPPACCLSWSSVRAFAGGREGHKQWRSLKGPAESGPPTHAGSSPGTGRAQARDGRLAREARAQPEAAVGQKHLARKMWACVRIASRLLAWRGRARALRQRNSYGYSAIMLDQCVEWCAPHTANRISIRAAARGVPIDGDRKLTILVGTLLLQQWPSARARRPRPAALPAPTDVVGGRSSAAARVQSLFELTNSKPTKLALSCQP